MKERGKAVKESNGKNYYSDSIYSSLDPPCKKHPSSSGVGICAYCLNERLMKLVCSKCGEQRVSSCSCSDISSYRNSCSAIEVGGISFLIENEKTDHPLNTHSKPKKGEKEKSDEVIMLKRSGSSCIELERSKGFWRIGKLFRKKREKQGGDMWVCDYMGVSRTRSVCSFRASAFTDPEHERSEFAFSSAKISDVNEAEPRRSGFSGVMDAENVVVLKELENDASIFPNKCAFPMKESDFSCMDGSGFIDLKLDLSPDSKTGYSVPIKSDIPISVTDHYVWGGSMKEEDRVFGHGGSCRITVNEERIKKGSKGHKIWRWIFSNQYHSWRSVSKKDENNLFKL